MLLALIATAQAGGLGIIGAAGLHTERAYYYTPEGVQGIDTQSRPNGEFGIQGLLGDRDDRVLGTMQFFFQRDAPLNTPDTAGISGAVYPPADELPPHDVLAATIGVQWGLLGDPTKLQLILNSNIGSAFATTDSTEYLIAQVAPGGTLNLTDSLQAFGTVGVGLRYRKEFQFGGDATVGIRWMFD